MQLKFAKEVLANSQFASEVVAMEWSSDGKKLATITMDRQLCFFNENCERVEKIATRSFDIKKPNELYYPTSLAFSSDGQQVVIGQSDCAVYIYQIGKNFEKKSLTSRFPLHAGISAICWLHNDENPLAGDIIAGCVDGVVYKLNAVRKSKDILCSFECFTELLQQKQVSCDGQEGTPGTPVQAIHQINATQCVIVNENGISALFDIDQAILRVSSRHESNITASTLFHPRQSDKQYLLICDVAGKVIVNSVETSQALAEIPVKTPEYAVFTQAVGNPAGNGAIIACSYGIFYVFLESTNPFSCVCDIESSLETVLTDGPQVTTSALAWRPDSSQLIVANSIGGMSQIKPSLGQFNYCGVEVMNTAPNKFELRLKNFNSHNSNLSPGLLELYSSISTEMKEIKAYPKELFVDAIKSGEYKVPCYLVGFGDRSIAIYSFEQDLHYEIEIQIGNSDKLFFDVGVKRVLVISNMQLGEFTVIYLPNLANQQPIMFATIRQCSFASKSVISCSPQLDGERKFVNVSHIGEDRHEFVITELVPPDDTDDFQEPLSVLTRIKHTRIIDWIDMSPTGKLVMIRDVSGAILVYSIEQSKLIDLSPTLGNGIIQWAAPFDVLVAQEQSDAPVLVYYNPGDENDKPDLLQVPTDNCGWTFEYLDTSQVVLTGNRQSASIFAIVERADGERRLQLQLDGDLLLFNMLLEQQEVSGACILLSRSNSTNRNQWSRLCELALRRHQFMVVSRCYAALGDVGLSRYARRVHNDLRHSQKQFESEYAQQTYCEAQVCLLRGDLAGYDRFIVQCGRGDEALQIYKDLRLYHRAERLCPEEQREQLHTESISWLVQTQESTLAAQLKAQRGDFRGALELLLNDRAYLAAFELSSQVLARSPDALSQNAVEALAGSLEAAGHFAEAARLVEIPPIKDPLRALGLYRRGQAFQEAIALARQTNPGECLYIESEWAQELVATGHYDLAIQHFIEARDVRHAVDAAIKASDYDTAERLLQSTTNRPVELCLRLAEAKFLNAEVDAAVKWFASADQPLLAMTALTSVARYSEAVAFAHQNFPGSNCYDILVAEAKRIISIEEKRIYKNAAFAESTVTQIEARMEAMSVAHGVLAAKELLAAAGMHDNVIELLQANQMYDELVTYAKQAKVKNLTDVLAMVSGAKRAKGDMRGCANLLGDLAIELFKQENAAGKTQSTQAGSLKTTLKEATQIFNELGMFEDSIELCKRCGDNEVLVLSAIQWMAAQPSQMQIVINILSKLNQLEQTIAKTTDERLFDLAMQLADSTASPEKTKLDIWYRQGVILEHDNKLTEAEHAYTMAERSTEALNMYIDHKCFSDAERVANNMPGGQQKDAAIRQIKEGRARALLDEGKFKDAEQLYMELDAIDDIVAQYSRRQMWQEALRISKANGRQDLVVRISEEFAEQDNRMKSRAESEVIAGAQSGPKLSEVQALKQKEQMQAQKVEAQMPTSLRGKIIYAAKQGGELFLDTLLQRVQTLSELTLAGKITDEIISDDIAIIGSQIPNLHMIVTCEERAIYVAATYLLKGVPQAVVNEDDKSKSTISPLFHAKMNSQPLLFLAKASLALEYQEKYYLQTINKLEVQRDGIYGKIRSILLQYRQCLMASQKGQQLAAQNKILIIPGDAELSKCTDAIHLLVQCAHCLAQPNSNTQLREKCQITGSLVRYCDLIPVDRCLALAGLTARQFYLELQGETSAATVQMRRQFGGQAFVFLNRLLDVIEHQQNGIDSTGDLDATDLKNTGIPWDVAVPKIAYLSDGSLEDVKSFVMQISVEQADDIDQALPLEECPHGCGTQRWIGAIQCVKCRNLSPVCCITGQHCVNKAHKTYSSQPACSVCSCYARPVAWNNWINKTKSCPVCGEMANPMNK